MKHSKHQRVKQHLISGYTISGVEALNMFGLYRLSSAINKLRNRGLNIQTKITAKGYARYFMLKGDRVKAIDFLFNKP